MAIHKPDKESAAEAFRDVGLNVPDHLAEGVPLTGYEDPITKRLLLANHLLRKANMVTLSPLLPMLLNLKGDPYTLVNHFPFEPFFRTRVPHSTVMKCGRQVSKSTSLASHGILMANCIPHFSTLFLTPLYEQVRRFSQNYIRPFIETSPVKALFAGKGTMNSVLQRTFKNRSQLLFSFAFVDAERVRGVSADRVCIDEIQNMDKDLLPVIMEVMSASKYDIRSYAGTPLSMENTIEGLWRDSSMAEWVVKCHHMGCRYYNVPTITHDLDDMIGPLHDEMSERKPGCICAKCGKPLQPRTGSWIHAYPDRRWQFAGYHVPQIVMPMHYASKSKWATLLGKRAGKGNTQPHQFYNEVCGESSDTGSRMITMTDLQKAGDLGWEPTVEQAVAHLGRYQYRVLAVDWGGGGQEGVSFTTLAALGIRPDGKIECFWGHRSLTPHDHIREAKLVLAAMGRLQCHVLAHDYNGAGSLRETLIHQAGVPLEKIVAIQYVRAASSSIMKFKPASVQHPRDHYSVDKSRSLLLTCNHIKQRHLRFFNYDYKDADDQGLLHDFLALVEEKSDSRTGKDIYTIIRDPHRIDDFAQAVNMGCCTLWHMTQKWPNVAAMSKYKMSEELMQSIHPINEVDWDDVGDF